MEHDSALTSKEEEVEALRARVCELEALMSTGSTIGVRPEAAAVPPSADSPSDRGTGLRITQPRRGKAPPIDPFNGDSPEFHLDDWLPTLKKAATWNAWRSF